MRELRLELTEVVYSVDAFDRREPRSPYATKEEAGFFGQRRSDFSKNSFSARFRQCHKSEDERRAVLLLHAVGWGQTVRAARKLVGRGSRDDLIAVSPLFAAAYPEDRTWERLCTSTNVRVREAAAEAARAQGGRPHVPELIRLCEDVSPSVRTGAFHSLKGILGDAVTATGYDPADPKPAALEKLRQLR